MSTQARLEHHLGLLDELAEIGLALGRRLIDDGAALENAARDFDLISRAVRRTLLLSHHLQDGLLAPRPPQPARDPAPRPPSIPTGAIRLDQIDRLDDISGDFQHVVTEIIRDIQTVLASQGLDTLTLETAPARSGLPPEADQADLN